MKTPEPLRRRSALLGVPAFATLALGLTLAAWGQPVPAGETQTIGLEYQGEVETAEPAAGGGGLVGRIEGIAREIEGADAGATAHAKLALDLTPALSRQADGRSRVSLLVANSALTVSPGMGEEEEGDVRREARFVQDKLALWAITLTPAQEQQLTTEGAVSLPVVEPFEPLQLLSKPVLTITVKEPVRAEAATVSFVARAPVFRGYDWVTLDTIAYDTTFWIQVVFKESPPEAEKRVRLDWGGSGALEVTAKRTGESGEARNTYRTGPLRLAMPEPPPGLSPSGASATDYPEWIE